MENAVIPTSPTPGIHPETGRPVTVIGVDASGLLPRLIVMVSDIDGTWAETVDYVKNRPQ